MFSDTSTFTSSVAITGSQGIQGIQGAVGDAGPTGSSIIAAGFTENNLVFTKDLTMKENPKYKHTNCFYEEKVQTNKKYYYLFRFLNEQRCTGYLAPIQVAELIDDGGYKYSNFDVIFESELFEESKQQHSIPFKKVMEIVPSAHHVMISDKDIDYTSPAADAMSQISEQIGNAEDLIWGKTFKFRLTSKKTGRKIDFNIKYNLRDM